MAGCALQAHETTERHQYDTAHEEAGPQQPGSSRVGVQHSLIPVGRQYGQLAEKRRTRRVRCGTGLLTREQSRAFFGLIAEMAPADTVSTFLSTVLPGLLGAAVVIAMALRRRTVL